MDGVERMRRAVRVGSQRGEHKGKRRESMPATQLDHLAIIRDADTALTGKFADRLVVNKALDRRLVSFQANKTEGGYRWCKYKEGFSAPLMRFLFDELGISSGRILDPFAGSGTALFIASELGLDATGIELLPSSAEVIEVRRLLRTVDAARMATHLRQFSAGRVWERTGQESAFGHLRITDGAFPKETERQLGRYLLEASRLRDKDVARVLRFAALCVLESVSYTRKDGQYLRWDVRSGRRVGTNPFHKGPILEFTDAITTKIAEIAGDLIGGGELFDKRDPQAERAGEIGLLRGSCIERLPRLAASSFSAIITSPPYCNRYDYTRTYALELALLGTDEESMRDLRQTMLSCTVENREKERLAEFASPEVFEAATEAWQSQQLLQLIVEYLDRCRAEGTINNNGIPRMVANYFRELAIVIFECARVLQPGAPFVMVNDNVRYQGAHVPVDLMLSDFAQQAGFDVETIWVLPRGKGNSSQQMGEHGREEVRKCVYVWRKRSKERPTTRQGRRVVPAR
jgi:DNA modification methylase